MSEEYVYHLGIYSKLIRGRNPSGPIKQGTEARLTGKSANFPKDLIALCQPEFFFADQPGIVTIDPRQHKGGVFVYQPTYVNGKHYGVFARLQARPEQGMGVPSRNFTHVALLVVEDKWEPGLIPWAANMLFTDKIGGRCWGEPTCEGQDDRMELVLPQIAAQEREVDFEENGPALERSGKTYFVHHPMPKTNDGQDDSPYPRLAHFLADFLDEYDLNVQGRWLSFAMGISTKVIGHDQGYFFRFDDRPEDAPPRTLTLNFNDQYPPAVTTWNFSEKYSSSNGARLFDWRHMASPNSNARSGLYASVIGPNNFWETQADASGLAPSAENHAAEPRPAATQSQAGFNDHATIDAVQSFVKNESKTELEAIDPPFLFNSDLAEVFASNRQTFLPHAFRHLERRTKVSSVYFRDYHFGQDDIEVVHAYWFLLELCTAFFLGDTVEKLQRHVRLLFEHEPIENLGFTGQPNSNLHEFVFGRLIQQVGVQDILYWVDRMERIEHQEKRRMEMTGEVSRGVQSFVPRKSSIREFLQSYADRTAEPDGEFFEDFWKVWKPQLDVQAGSLRGNFLPEIESFE